MIEWMGRNFDVFPDFRKFLTMRNIALYSVYIYFSDIAKSYFC